MIERMSGDKPSQRALFHDLKTVIIMFLTFGCLLGLVVVGDAWGWWAAVLTVGLLFVLWLVVSFVAERFRWKRRGILDEPTLRDVRTWMYRSDVDVVLADLGADEKVVLAVPATRQDPNQNGVLVLTNKRLLFRRSGARKEGLLSVTRGRVEAVSIKEDAPWAYLQVTLDDHDLAFRLLSQGARAWTLAGHFMAELDATVDTAAPEAPSTSPASARQLSHTQDEDAQRAPPTQLTVSPEAAREIERRGGSLYLWQEEFTANLVVDKLDTRPPDAECEFESLARYGFNILIDSRIPPAETIAVSLRRFPRRRIEVMFDGAPWGRRGAIVD